MKRQPMTDRQLECLIVRAGGKCERCGGDLGLFGPPPYEGRGEVWSVQHRRPAAMGGTNSPTFNEAPNVLLLCGSGTTGCHGYVEAHPAEARDMGWSVGQYLPPDMTAVWLAAFGKKMILTHSWKYLDPDALAVEEQYL